MSENFDKLIFHLTRKYSKKKEPITKREIFDYMQTNNYNIRKLDEVIYKLYINSFYEIDKIKQELKTEKLSRNSLEERLNLWLAREYYRPPNTEGGPGFYESKDNFNKIINSDYNHH